jgi:hypothetical protein
VLQSPDRAFYSNTNFALSIIQGDAYTRQLDAMLEKLHSMLSTHSNEDILKERAKLDELTANRDNFKSNNKPRNGTVLAVVHEPVFRDLYKNEVFNTTSGVVTNIENPTGKPIMFTTDKMYDRDALPKGFRISTYGNKDVSYILDSIFGDGEKDKFLKQYRNTHRFSTREDLQKFQDIFPMKEYQDINIVSKKSIIIFAGSLDCIFRFVILFACRQKE